MNFKVDKGLLPVKAHFFFFFAALGPLLPQMNVFGRQLGVSPGGMGIVTAVLPLLWALAKPLFGYLVDYFTNQRKLIFMLLIAVMSGSYCSLWFLPMPLEPSDALEGFVYRLNDTIYLDTLPTKASLRQGVLLEKYSCHWNCRNSTTFQIWFSNTTYVNTIYSEDEISNATCALLHMDFNDVREGKTICTPKDECDLLCFQDDLVLNKSLTSLLNNTVPKNRTRRGIDSTNTSFTDNNRIISMEVNKEGLSAKDIRSKVVAPVQQSVILDDSESGATFYTTGTFWCFVVLMCVGTVAFNVANCIGDAVCFDVLGAERASKYGSQRAWGTVGYGMTALLGGWLVDLVSDGPKDFTPAFVLALAFTFLDLLSCRSLKLPSLSSPSDAGAALREVLRMPKVLVFIMFAVVAGTFDSFIIYYMFWFLEELSESTGHRAQIKLIEGVVVAAESFGGELLFFFFSGRIIKRWGYGSTMTFSLVCYGIRLGLISLITNPWHLVFIEGVMQGPTYALCYSCIVGYAAHVAPEGYSATVQGIVAGMDDGLGFAIGSLLGGLLYSAIGGRSSFRVMAASAAVAATAHVLLRRYVLERGTGRVSDEDKELPEGQKMLPVQHDSAIYRDTVVSLSNGGKAGVGDPAH